MSTLYNLEPNPTAKVLLRTTVGDLELELFAKQTPVTSRNFLQLCLDEYYNNTIFHRLVPGWIIQGGDPTGTGHGGESSYEGNPFEDEYHSRLKFNRRGLLGMANEGTAKTNGSQFFMTLGPTPELQGTNTLFGRIAGDTIFNLMKMGEAELPEGSERPTYPTRIIGTEILVNPFEDMVKRVKVVLGDREEEKKPKKAKRKAGKQLLSFGADELEDGEPLPTIKKPKYNTKLVSAGPQDPSVLNSAPMPKAPKKSEKPVIEARKTLSASPSSSPPPKVAPPRTKATEKAPSPSPSTSPEPDSVAKVSSLLDETNAQIAALKTSMKRTVAPTTTKESKPQSALSAMIPETSIRGRKRRQGGAATSAADEKAALSFLSAFKAKLNSAPAELLPLAKTPPVEAEPIETVVSGGGDDEEAALCDLHFIANCQSCSNWANHGEDDVEDDAGWMGHSLSFAKDRLGKDLEWKRKNEQELVVIDPREKSAKLKEEKRGKERNGRR